MEQIQKQQRKRRREVAPDPPEVVPYHVNEIGEAAVKLLIEIEEELEP